MSRCGTFLASSILFSKMYVMQFLTTSRRRALLASTLPWRSTTSPVETEKGGQTGGHSSPAPPLRTPLNPRWEDDWEAEFGLDRT